MCAVWRVSLLPLAVADGCTGSSSSSGLSWLGGGLWGKPQRRRTMCVHGLLATLLWWNDFKGISKAGVFFTIDWMGIVDVVGLNFWPDTHNLQFFSEVYAMLYSHPIPPSLIFFFFLFLLFLKTTDISLLDILRLLVLRYIRNTTAVDILFIQAIVQLLHKLYTACYEHNRLSPINRQPSSALSSVPEPVQLKKVSLSDRHQWTYQPLNPFASVTEMVFIALTFALCWMESAGRKAGWCWQWGCQTPSFQLEGKAFPARRRVLWKQRERGCVSELGAELMGAWVGVIQVEVGEKRQEEERRQCVKYEHMDSIFIFAFVILVFITCYLSYCVIKSIAVRRWMQLHIK